MAEEKKKFQLDKGGNHKFDISKGSKRRFDLSKDDDEPAVANVADQKSVQQPAPAPKQPSVPKPAPQPAAPKVVPTPEPPVPGPTSRGGGMKWLWILLAVVIVALLIWWLIPSKSQTPVEVAEPEDTAMVAPAAEDEESPADSVAAISADEVTETTSESEAAAPAAAPAPAAAEAPEPAVAPSTASVSSDVDAEAMKVIRGDYGNGHARKNRLGSQYSAIQARVNELKRSGAF